MAIVNIDEKAVFNHARNIAAPEERNAYLQQACGHDPETVGRLLKLLHVYEQEQSFLESPPVVGATMDPLASEHPGTIIGPYKLLEQIGEGGFGVVFMAEQTEPVRRKVALKILKPGMDTRQVVARFEAERQALAIMDHPNIARVFDGGQTPTGRPFFVMELVRGTPITEYCDQHQLSIRDRLALFLNVCQAVQHAHQKGIIHRDLKPSNILIASHDGAPVVKVIDFGIAKAMTGNLTDKTLFTGFAQMIGTPMYMSPEQAGYSDIDVDTRSDIYSLGVLLYELLTGTTPFNKEQLSKLGLDDLRRILREEEPPRPSTRLSTLGQAATTASTNRKSEPRTLSQHLRGELDWIVMKAMEKDRNRRYETASAFAADVGRYLNDQPVQACPPSAAYRVRKFARRNKAGVAISALALVFVMSLSAGAGLWYQSEQDRSARELATIQIRQEHLTKDMAKLFDEAERQRQKIHTKLADPIKVCELLSNIDGWHETLAKARTAWQNAKNLAASNDDVLPAGLTERLQHLDDELHADEADWKIAKRLDDIRMSRQAFEGGNSAAAGPEYKSFFSNRGLNWKTNSPAEIAPKLRQAKLRYVLVAALDHWCSFADRATCIVLMETARLADQDHLRDRLRNPMNDQQTLARVAQEINVSRQSPHSLAWLAGCLQNEDAVRLLRAAILEYPQDFWLNLGLAKSLRKNPDEMIGYCQACLALRPTSSMVHFNLGLAFSIKRDLNEAVHHNRKAIELNPNHAPAHYNLGNNLRDKNDPEGAMYEYRKTIALDPKHASAQGSLGNLLRDRNEVDSAIVQYRKAIGLNPNHAITRLNMGIALRRKNDLDGAIAEYHNAIKLDPDYAEAHTSLGNALFDKKDVDGAIRHWRKSVDLDPNGARAHAGLGQALFTKKDIDGAILHGRKAVELDPTQVAAHNALGISLCYKKDLNGAIRHLRKAIELDPNSVAAHSNLGIALSGSKDIEGAMQHYRKALSLNPNYVEAHLNLAQALRDTGRFAEALEQMKRGHELGSRQPGWPHPTTKWVKELEGWVKLDQQVPAALKGDVPLTSLREWLGYLDICQRKKAYSNAFHLWNQLFAKQPALADSLKARFRFRAAQDAVLASATQDPNAANIMDTDRAAMRKRANDWLHADLDSGSTLLQKKQPDAAFALANQLQEWQKNVDLSGVRDEPNLAKLPADERKAWQKLWTEVEQLRKQAAAMFQTTARFSGAVTAKERDPVFEVKLQTGTFYVIDLESKAFDTFLRLENAQGKKLGENDDVAPATNTNSRLIFTPKTDGVYRLVASAFENRGTGAYTLTIREFVK